MLIKNRKKIKVIKQKYEGKVPDEMTLNRQDNEILFGNFS
jgi:hypothetical protein